MKKRNLALSVTTVVLASITAFPAVTQAAIEQSNRAQSCHTQNDMLHQYGLPTVDCAAGEKTVGEAAVKAAVKDDRAHGRTAMKEPTPTPGSAGNLTQW